MTTIECNPPAIQSQKSLSGSPGFTPRVARLHERLQEAMLRKQESWKPASLVLEPEMACLPQPLNVLPGSPQRPPLLLRRAQKMATMNFVEALQELNLANLDQLRPSFGSALEQPAAGEPPPE